ncbi:J domain-containing protein [Geminocystis herdmanii]|uniref:J domain-containing protein n=1 Tax=Geminocystis herdmanii TaxID=669359 RepID=UPI0003492F6D|nr:J domain-containing protein [Geminocystis herdmanii]
MTDLDRYYSILELSPNATKDDIKKAYRTLAKKWHPDNFIDNLREQNLATEKFININEAYNILIQENQHLSSENNSQEIKINREKDTSIYQYRLGVLAAENEEWEEAIFYFTHAIKINENFAEAYFYRGSILEKQGFNLRAEADFNKFNQLKGKINHNNSAKVADTRREYPFYSKFRSNPTPKTRSNRVIYQKSSSKKHFKYIFLFGFITILLIPFISNFYHNFKFLQWFHKYAEESLKEKELSSKMQETFNDYGGNLKSIETAQYFCQFLQENYPISKDFSSIKQQLTENETKYLRFISDNASLVGEFFTNGDIPPNTPHGIEAISWGITFASVKVYCPEYKPLFFIRS